MGEDPVDSATHGAQLGDGALLDADPAGEIFVAVEETRCPIQCVPRIVCGELLVMLFIVYQQLIMFAGVSIIFKIRVFYKA